ncbi:MAG: heavy-metal-associated domain-containing protein [Cyanophyceae cyanobacterium]
MTTHHLTIPKLACGACVATVTKTVQSLDVSAQVQGDPATKAVVITSSLPEVQIREALSQVGYPAA